jgi:hypothetical protein
MGALLLRSGFRLCSAFEQIELARAVALPWRKIYKPLNFFLCFSPSKIGTLPAFLGEGPEGTARSAGKQRSDKAAVPLQRNTNVSGRPGGFLV